MQNRRADTDARLGQPVAAQDPPRNDALVDFIRSVVNPRGAFVSVVVRQDRVVGHAQGTVRLQRSVDITFDELQLSK